MDISELRQSRLRRRTAPSVAGVALLVGLIVLSPKLVAMYATSSEEGASATTVSRAQPDPAAMQAMLDRTATEAGFSVKVSSKAQDTQSNVIAGSDRRFAKRWVTSAVSPSGHELNVIVISEPFMSLESAQKDCEARLAAGHAITCVASAKGDLVVQDIERGAERFTDGWPVVTTDQWDQLGTELWILHQAIVRSPNGTTVYAHEAAKARGLSDARGSWQLPQASLRDSAITLAVPLWKDPTTCGWVLAAKSDQQAC